MPLLCWNPYLSIYNKDYVKKTIKRVKAAKPQQEFEDPVGEGYKNYLVLDSKQETKKPEEDADEYLQKFKELYAKAGRLYFQDPLDHDAVIMKKIMDSVTEYQEKYCDIVKDLEFYKELKSKKFSLPDNYEIALTTYNNAYKNPILLNSNAHKKRLVVIPPNSLGTNEEINEILNVKTGISEYEDVIGDLAYNIMESRLATMTKSKDITSNKN